MRTVRSGIPFLVSLLAALPAPASPPWLDEPASETLAERVPAPEGSLRTAAPEGSFASWLRSLPVRPGRPPVHLFDGRTKANHRAHHLVFDVDVGTRNLQQCADAVIRLRAEYLWDAGCRDAIAFDFTSGDRASWRDWRHGLRPRVEGRNVSWSATASPDAGYRSFRRYLDVVFTYAGTASLARELDPVADATDVRPGDVFVQGGFPGHAVVVVDVAETAEGERFFLLAQSFMPAQEIHLLVGPEPDLSPWYPVPANGRLATPEWTFRVSDLRRFPGVDCQP